MQLVNQQVQDCSHLWIVTSFQAPDPSAIGIRINIIRNGRYEPSLCLPDRDCHYYSSKPTQKEVERQFTLHLESFFLNLAESIRFLGRQVIRSRKPCVPTDGLPVRAFCAMTPLAARPFFLTTRSLTLFYQDRHWPGCRMLYGSRSVATRGAIHGSRIDEVMPLTVSLEICQITHSTRHTDSAPMQTP